MAETHDIMEAIAATGGLFKHELLERLEIEDAELAPMLQQLQGNGFVEYREVAAGQRLIALTARGVEESVALGLVPDGVPDLRCQVRAFEEGSWGRCTGSAVAMATYYDGWRKDFVAVFVCAKHKEPWSIGIAGKTARELHEEARTGGFRLNLE
jgi:hypothetical protein